MNTVLVNYNFSPQDWWLDYGMEARVYDRSDDGVARTFAAKVIKTENRGNVDFDKLSFLVEFYDELPDVFLWGKTNLFKYITRPEFESVQHATSYTPLIRQDHRTYRDQLGLVNFYDQFGIYYERNDSWYMNVHAPSRYTCWADWALDFGLPSPPYLPFAPGGSYILTRETVHRYSRDLYQRMADTLPYCQTPVEAHLCERSYHLLWK